MIHLERLVKEKMKIQNLKKIKNRMDFFFAYILLIFRVTQSDQRGPPFGADCVTIPLDDE
tara:strand:- start:374 stop:553 length:180 start_codon:yes stop_codon:yes gene_type:complete